MKRLLCLLLFCTGCGGSPNVTQLMQSALQHRDAGEVRTAIIELKNLLQREPSNTAARLLLGEIYLGVGDVLAAEKELQKALELGTVPEHIWPRLSEALAARGAAAQVLQRLPAVAAGNSPALLVVRAQALLASNQAGAARDSLEQALRLQPGFSPALLGLARLAVQDHDMPRAASLVETILQQNGRDSNALRMQADLLRLDGKLARATEIYQQVCHIAPWLIQPQLELATLQIQQSQYPQAHTTLDRGRKLAPQNALLLYTEAMLDVQEKKYVPARDRLQLVLRSAPDYPPANLLMASVQRSLNDYPQAERSLRAFLASYPQHPAALRQLAALQLAMNQPAQALETLNPLMAQLHPDAGLLALAGESYMRLHHYAKASALFEQASVLAPEQPMLLAALAVGRLGQGQPAAASQVLQKAAELDSASIRIGVLQVLSLMRLQQYAQANSALQPLLKKYPDNPMLRNLHGGVLLLLKQLPAARTQFELALKLVPTFLPALDNLSRMDLAEGQGERARLRLEAAWRRDATNTDLMLALSELAGMRGETDLQGVWLQRAQQARPEDAGIILRYAAYLLAQKQADRATALLRQLLSVQPENYAALDMLAQQQIIAREFDAAIPTLARLVALQPSDPALQLRTAVACEGAGLAECANTAFRKALELQADYLPAYTAQVHYQLRQRNYVAAMRSLLVLRTRQPHVALSYRLEGDVHMAQQHYAYAVAAYQQAQKMAPSSAHVQALYAAQLRSGHVQQADLQIGKWLDAHADDLLTRLYWADSLRQQKEYAGSQRQLEILLEQQPESPTVLNNLAWIYQQRGDPRALALAERAVRLAPDHPLVLDTLGWLLYENGAKARALGLLRRAASVAPTDSSIRQHLAAIQAANNGVYR